MPRSAEYQSERQHVVDEYWAAGEEDTARLIAEGDLSIAVAEESGFLPDGWTLVNVSRREGHVRLSHYVVSDSSEVVSLTGHPDSYNDFAELAGIEVGSGDDAIEVAEFYLTMTRDSYRYRATLADVDDLTLDNSTDPTVKAEVSEAREDAEDVVSAPEADESDDGYDVTVFFQQDKTIQSWSGTVAPDATLDGETSEHTTDLPVTFTD